MKTLAICSNRKKNSLNSNILEINLYKNNFVFGLFDFESDNINLIKLKSNEIAVKVRAFSCNYRDRSLMLSFNQKCINYANTNQIFFSPFGSDFVAEIVKIGSKVSEFQLGDRVIPDCTYPFRIGSDSKGIPTNYASQRFHVLEESQLLKIPDSMLDEVAAGFSIASQTAYSMIRKANIKGGENIIVTSATSNTSLTIISALRDKNVNIYAVTKNLSCKSKLLKLGVKKVIPFENIICNDATFLKKDFDIVFDPFFDLHFNYLVKYLKDFGRYLYCGMYMQNKSFDKHTGYNDNYFSSFTYSIMKNISIIANCLGDKVDLENAINDYNKGGYNIIIDSIFRDNKIKPFIEKTFSLKKRFGKVIYCYE